MGDYARLSTFDRCFLDIEDRATHMHIAATCIFDAAPLTKSNGTLDAERIRRYVHGRLGTIPRYRQRLAFVPLEQHPVWVDDYRFNLGYHIRHVSVPKPGDERQLKRLLAWIISQQLDRDRPLWEMWIIEGLQGNRFAICQKVHHAMIDGLAGVEEMAVLLDPDPAAGVDFPDRWQPREAPGSLELLRDAAVRRMSMPLTIAGAAIDAVRSDPWSAFESLRNATFGLGSLVADAVSPGSETALNRPIGTRRRFDWTSFDLDNVKAVKNTLGGTVNDVVLATVAGGLRRFLLRQGKSADEVDELRIRAMCPVNRRSVTARSTIGNNVAGMLVDLPVGADHPRSRLAAVRTATERSKSGRQAEGSVALASLCDYSIPSLFSLIERAATGSRLFNLIVTNIPGPQFPLYMLGAQMLETFPLVPLFPNQGLAIAVFSYGGRLHWGFNADRDVLPDLHGFVAGIESSFAELAGAADAESASVPSGDVPSADSVARA